MRNLTLIVFSAYCIIIAILLTDRLKGPGLCLVTVEALNAILMVVAGLIFFISNAHLLTVTTLALAGDGAGAPWVQLLLQVGGILALGRLFLLLNRRGVTIFHRCFVSLLPLQDFVYPHELIRIERADQLFISLLG